MRQWRSGRWIFWASRRRIICRKRRPERPPQAGSLRGRRRLGACPTKHPLARRRTKSENRGMPELIGIAKMAAQSELLEAKGPADSPVKYFEIGARSILNRTKPNMPFQWTINPYRGCEFGCH